MPTPITPFEPASSVPFRLLAFGAHPDDLEFGAGGLLLSAAAAGAAIHLVLASRGEAGTSGTPAERENEARAAAAMLGAEISWIDMGGDAHMRATTEGVIDVARVVRQVRPTLVLAPTTTLEQHPDHAVLGGVVRDALRVARYGNITELADLQPWPVSRFFQYAITPSAEPAALTRLMVDISAHQEAWLSLMRCHGSQMKTRNYLDLQFARARNWGLQAGVELAQMLFTAEPLVFDSPSDLPSTARLF